MSEKAESGRALARVRSAGLRRRSTAIRALTFTDLRTLATPLARRVVPLSWRIERVRMLRYPSWLLEGGAMARHQATASERAEFSHELSAHRSPLRRPGTVYDAVLQRGKETNVARAAALLDGLVIEAGQVFSYHHAVGRPSYRRGFVDGPELRDSEESLGVGGGCCQVTNLLFWMGLHAGLKVVERHRHSLDLYPDSRRTVPFGCGATVFYNQADLRLQNVDLSPLLLSIRIENGVLLGSFLSPSAARVMVEVYEVDHAFEQTAEGWVRSNKIRRRFRVRETGEEIWDEEVLRNRARLRYDPRESGAVSPLLLDD